jgi:predicted RNA methylase
MSATLSAPATRLKAVANNQRGSDKNAAPKLGNTRVTGKEQFYTPIETARFILEQASDLIPDLASRHLLEPAGGTGAFIEAAREFGLTRVTSVDIEPLHPKVKLGSFLDLELTRSDYITISNPPFGRNNSLSIPFFNHAAPNSDLIAFIVPRSWRKWSVINKLDRNFQLVRDLDLAINYVNELGYEINAKDRLRTCVQFWARTSTPRPLIQVQDMNVISKVTPAEADVALTIFGYNCGTVSENFTRIKNTTQMYLKLNHPKALTALKSANFKQFYLNTATTEALSIAEINYALNEVIFRDPKLKLID